MENTEILGVKITTSSEKEILDYINEELSKPKAKRKKIVIFTPNPEQISLASRQPQVKNILNQADIALPDGVGVLLAARLLDKPIISKITGIDFMKTLVKSISERPVITGYFGGQKQVAEQAALCLQKMTQSAGRRMAIGYASDVYDKQKMIQSDIDILFVGLGFPKQEQWVIDHKDEIPATVLMVVGGSFDFLSGRVARAPLYIRLLGFEWLFRLIVQPWRFWRQLRLLDFSAKILQEALSSHRKRQKN